MPSIEDYMNGSDPLTREVADFLLQHAEEDDRVDYKQTIDIDSSKDWINISKDISAFANTFGGYLVYGVADSDKSVVGLERSVERVLKDANNLQLKINSFIEPDIKSIRSKAFRFNGKIVVLIYTPQSCNVTHIVKKDGIIYKQSKSPKTILNKGTFYVRRSASNHLGDSRDFDDVVERRINQFRDALIDKVARVVKTPASSNLFILSKDPEDAAGERFIIEDSPDSIPVKGMSFTVSPQGIEEEIAAWSVLSSGRSNIKPPPEIVWSWYSQREDLAIREPHKLAVFQFSLWVAAPAFYWIQHIENSIVRDSLISALRSRPIGTEVKQFMSVSSFLGKSTYRAALKTLGDYVNRIPSRLQNFPAAGPRKEFGTFKISGRQTPTNLKKEKLKELNELVSGVAKSRKDAGAMKKWKAQDIDCFLYAQDDNYKKTNS